MSRINELEPVRFPEENVEENKNVENDIAEDEEQDDDAQMDLFK